MDLTMTTESRGTSTVLCLSGDVDMYSCSALRKTVEGLLVNGGDTVLLDFGQVNFLDSSGLGTLIGLQKRANLGRAELVLCGIPPHIQKIFDVTHLSDAFTIVPEAPPA
jgi:anti-sigma B factor antagonist